MKNFKFILFSLIFIGLFSFTFKINAQVRLGVCTLPSLSSGGATAPGYDESQCLSEGGTWEAYPDPTPTPTPKKDEQTSSWGGLVTCENNCDFNALMAMVHKLINFIFVVLAIPICALMFAYAGFLMVSAGGESAHAKTQAKEIFFNTVIGMILIGASWLIVHFILYILGYDGSWIGF